jgi:hypothetical protein
MMATYWGHKDVVRLLLSNGADAGLRAVVRRHRVLPWGGGRGACMCGAGRGRGGGRGDMLPR